MRVLITGATGFIGQRLVARLVHEKVEVCACYRDVPLPISGVDWQKLVNLTDDARLAAILSGCEAVVHLAALAHQLDPLVATAEAFQRVNVDGTSALASTSRRCGVRRIVFISSIGAVCSGAKNPIDDATRPTPDDLYGKSKLAAEIALAEALRDSATDWCALRPPLIYGPGAPGNMRRLTHILAKGWPLPFASVRNCRSFLSVDNLVDAILCVLRHPRVIRSAYVLEDGGHFSTPALLKALADASGRPARLFAVPTALLKALGRGGDVIGHLTHRNIGFNSTVAERLTGSLVLDGSRFRNQFNWTPPVPPAEAMQRFGASLRAAEESP